MTLKSVLRVNATLYTNQQRNSEPDDRDPRLAAQSEAHLCPPTIGESP